MRLSGGERQRLALARALLRAPALLILDEATTSLDAANRDAIWAAVASLRGRTTVLMISHEDATLEHADRVVVLDAGKVLRTYGASPRPVGAIIPG
jgi:ABC-type multidrug transport system fused ATPase/permease subunit